MEVPVSEIAYLSAQQICEINRRMCLEFGGLWEPPDNLRVSGALDFTLEQMQGSVFGKTLAPTLIDKAAALGHSIIARHIFNDANKRTGLQAVWEFLGANGITLNLDSSAEDIALRVADGSAGFDDLRRWIEERCLAAMTKSAPAGPQPPPEPPV
jgi:death-on-curing protein